MEYASAIPRHLHTAELLYPWLRNIGAPEMCYVVSEDKNIDGQEMLLLIALQKTRAMGMGTFISCVPGKLVYFEDEDGHFLLTHE